MYFMVVWIDLYPCSLLSNAGTWFAQLTRISFVVVRASSTSDWPFALLRAHLMRSVIGLPEHRGHADIFGPGDGVSLVNSFV